MHVAILGFAGQGASTLAYWQALGHDITICDKNEATKLPTGVGAQLGESYLEGLERFDLLVRTPGIHPRDIVAANGEEILQKVTSNTNEFMRVCPTRNIIGVTGTKGKGTTCTLIARMLETAGYRVHLGGNIGIPPLELLGANITPEDYVVLELANFQLIDLKYSPHIAVCLMVEPEHSDWHAGFEEYTTAKQQLFYWQRPEDIAIFYAENDYSRHIAEASRGVKIPYFKEPGAVVTNGSIMMGTTEICATDEIELLGRHNWQNVAAAVTAVWQVTQDTEAIREAIGSVANLPNRLERVATDSDGVQYYNDSFASMPSSTMAAIDSIVEPKIMIIGGFDRGLDLAALASHLTEHQASIKRVLLIGDSAERTTQAFLDRGFSNYEIINSKDMTEIVTQAKHHAQPGDAVVLSPGFPSFDMFKNFEERGAKFKAAVSTL